MQAYTLSTTSRNYSDRQRRKSRSFSIIRLRRKRTVLRSISTSMISTDFESNSQTNR